MTVENALVRAGVNRGVARLIQRDFDAQNKAPGPYLFELTEKILAGRDLLVPATACERRSGVR